MRFHIVGMGPVGCLVAFHLKRTLPTGNGITIVHKIVDALQTARRNQGGIKVENQGVTLSATGFSHQTFDASAVLTPLLDAEEEEPDISTPSASLLEPPSTDTMPPVQKPKRSSRIESLIITTKAHSTLKVLRDLRTRIYPSSTIVLMQNGMGVYERIIEELYPNPDMRPHFIVASNNHGAWQKSYLHIVHAGIGNIKFGIMPDGQGRDFEASNRATASPASSWTKSLRPHQYGFKLKDIADRGGDPYYTHYESLRRTVIALTEMRGLHVQWQPIYEVQMAMRKKVVVNSVINPLTALLGCQNGEVFKYQEGIKLSYRICKEAFEVFYAQWEAERKVAADANQPSSDTEFPPELTTRALQAECQYVADITRTNHSSMLTDVRLARPTELHYMTGYLLSLGKRYNVAMPTNTAIYNLMQLRTKIPINPNL